jgi:DNA-directed RNA polymerase specialized sigma24 family protein
MSQRHKGVDLFAALILEWQGTAERLAARRAATRWAEQSPLLAGYRSPAQIVAAIHQAGDPDRSCRLLSELLAIAAGDDLAARAVLGAIVPGLRRAVRRRWSNAATRGPWQSEQDLAADALGAAWEAIHRHRGQRHPRPAAVIIRHVEGTLRRDHRRWCRHAVAIVPLAETLASEVSLSEGQARTPEEQSVTLIAEAARAGVIDPTDAALLLAVGVGGQATTQAGITLGITGRAAARRLRRARSAIQHRGEIPWRPQNQTSISHRRRPACPVLDAIQSPRGRP